MTIPAPTAPVAGPEHTKPLPCPFCGATPAEDYGETGHTIECVNRQCIAPSIFLDHEGEDFDTRSACVHRWNTRATPTAKATDVAAKP